MTTNDNLKVTFDEQKQIDKIVTKLSMTVSGIRDSAITFLRPNLIEGMEIIGVNENGVQPLSDEQKSNIVETLFLDDSPIIDGLNEYDHIAYDRVNNAHELVSDFGDTLKIRVAVDFSEDRSKILFVPNLGYTNLESLKLSYVVKTFSHLDEPMVPFTNIPENINSESFNSESTLNFPFSLILNGATSNIQYPDTNLSFNRHYRIYNYSEKDDRISQLINDGVNVLTIDCNVEELSWVRNSINYNFDELVSMVADYLFTFRGIKIEELGYEGNHVAYHFWNSSSNVGDFLFMIYPSVVNEKGPVFKGKYEWRSISDIVDNFSSMDLFYSAISEAVQFSGDQSSTILNLPLFSKALKDERLNAHLSMVKSSLFNNQLSVVDKVKTIISNISTKSETDAEELSTYTGFNPLHGLISNVRDSLHFIPKTLGTIVAGVGVALYGLWKVVHQLFKLGRKVVMSLVKDVALTHEFRSHSLPSIDGTFEFPFKLPKLHLTSNHSSFNVDFPLTLRLNLNSVVCVVDFFIEDDELYARGEYYVRPIAASNFKTPSLAKNMSDGSNIFGDNVSMYTSLGQQLEEDEFEDKYFVELMNSIGHIAQRELDHWMSNGSISLGIGEEIPSNWNHTLLDHIGPISESTELYYDLEARQWVPPVDYSFYVWRWLMINDSVFYPGPAILYVHAVEGSTPSGDPTPVHQGFKGTVDIPNFSDLPVSWHVPKNFSNAEMMQWCESQDLINQQSYFNTVIDSEQAIQHIYYRAEKIRNMYLWMLNELLNEESASPVTLDFRPLSHKWYISSDQDNLNRFKRWSVGFAVAIGTVVGIVLFLKLRRRSIVRGSALQGQRDRLLFDYVPDSNGLMKKEDARTLIKLNKKIKRNNLSRKLLFAGSEIASTEVPSLEDLIKRRTNDDDILISPEIELINKLIKGDS